MKELVVIDLDVQPGNQLNAEIARLMNYEVMSYGEDSWWYRPLGLNYSEIEYNPKYVWKPLPKFSDNIVSVAEKMEELGFIPYLKPTGEKTYVCFFDEGNKTFGTKPFKKASHAFACAFLFVLKTRNPYGKGK